MIFHGAYFTVLTMTTPAFSQMSSMDSLANVSLQALYSLRVELAFLLVFGLLYLTGRSTPQAKLQAAVKEQPCKREPGPSPTRRRKGGEGRESRARGGAAWPGQQSVPAEGSSLPLGSGSTTPTRQQKLNDPAWVVAEVLQLSRGQVHHALELYQAAQRAGLKVSDLSETELKQLFTALVTCSIRAGQPEEALNLLRDLQQAEEQSHSTPPEVDLVTTTLVGTGLLASVTKLCTSKQYFTECLAIYDLATSSEKERPGMPAKEEINNMIEDRSVWSCLLFCAVEAKCFQRCPFFFERLKAAGKPSPKDFGNMIRYAATMGESDLALELVREMRVSGVEIDSVVYNTALATCVSADNVDQARALLEDMEKVGGVADVITYNTLAKGYAKAGLMDRCFELYEHMRRQGIEPSQVTYGILLDGCINDNRVDRAAEVYERMVHEGCPMNTVLYTTLIKGFARAGQVDQAMRVYRQMRAEGSVPPDLITFSILIKANCDSSRLDTALKLLEAMVELKLRPDEVIFNNLLGGCVKDSNATLAKRLYQDMTTANIRPSNATFSILIRLYAQCKLLDEAVEMLRNEPNVQNVQPEPRLFSQLVLCCLRERQGRRAIEVYRLMLEHSMPTASAYSSMLGMCVKLNMLDTGVEILSLAAAAGARVDGQDAHALLEAAVRKKKSQCADACSVAMKRLGMQVSSPKLSS